jgi:hypothetical protein
MKSFRGLKGPIFFSLDLLNPQEVLKIKKSQFLPNGVKILFKYDMWGGVGGGGGGREPLTKKGYTLFFIFDFLIFSSFHLFIF